MIKDKNIVKNQDGGLNVPFFIWPLAMSCLDAKFSLFPNISLQHLQPYWSITLQQHTYKHAWPQSHKDRYTQATDIWAIFSKYLNK